MVIDLYSLIIYPLIYIFPAYVANAVPVIFGGGIPLDFKKNLKGKRVFGDHKTIRGTLSGIIAGSLIGYIESIIFAMPFLFAVSIALAIGAMFGDVIGSFIKRRMDVISGASVPIMDQYGFFAFALVFAFPVTPLADLPTIYGLLFLIALTGVLHLVMNIIAHKLKLKKVPW